MFTEFTDVIFFAVLAAIIVYRLYSVLGRKDFDSDINSQIKTKKPEWFKDLNDKSKIIDLEAKEVSDADILKKYGEQIAPKINELMKQDNNFKPDRFLQGAIKAFEMIIEAYAKGDKKTLEGLLDKHLYTNFNSAIDKRTALGQVQQTTIISVKSTKITDIEIIKKMARISVEIISEQVNIIKDNNGEIVEGHASQGAVITEIWTFSRNITSANPNWELVETRAGE